MHHTDLGSPAQRFRWPCSEFPASKGDEVGRQCKGNALPNSKGAVQIATDANDAWS